MFRDPSDIDALYMISPFLLVLIHCFITADMSRSPCSVLILCFMKSHVPFKKTQIISIFFVGLLLLFA